MHNKDDRGEDKGILDREGDDEEEEEDEEELFEEDDYT